MDNKLEKIIDALNRTKISHRRFESAVNELFAMASVAPAGEVVCLYGPSRVGKSRALNELERLLVGGGGEWGPGEMPLIRINARNASTSGYFSTKSFMMAALSAVRHPVYGSPLEDDRWGTAFGHRLHRTSEGTLSLALEHALMRRRTKYVVIDETQHLNYLPGSRERAASVLDSWKCLAADTGVVLIISGTYPLLPILTLSPHLLGRNHPVHFARYSSTKEEDVIEYERVLAAYSEWIPTSASSLRVWNRSLFNGSFGCVGHTARWLRHALSKARVRGETRLSRQTLAETMIKGEFRDSILREIEFGEAFLGGSGHTAPARAVISREGKRRTTRPFKAKPRSHPRGGRY